jgi:hypothetical protein
LVFAQREKDEPPRAGTRRVADWRVELMRSRIVRRLVVGLCARWDAFIVVERWLEGAAMV